MNKKDNNPIYSATFMKKLQKDRKEKFSEGNDKEGKKLNKKMIYCPVFKSKKYHPILERKNNRNDYSPSKKNPSFQPCDSPKKEEQDIGLSFQRL